MKALLVADNALAIDNISRVLEIAGYDVIIYKWLLKALDNVEEINPHLIVISCKDYPRHWKTLCQFASTSFSGGYNPEVILYAEDGLDDEETSKAQALNVRGIFTSVGVEGLDELRSILEKKSDIYSGRLLNEDGQKINKIVIETKDSFPPEESNSVEIQDDSEVSAPEEINEESELSDIAEDFEESVVSDTEENTEEPELSAPEEINEESELSDIAEDFEESVVSDTEENTEDPELSDITEEFEEPEVSAPEEINEESELSDIAEDSDETENTSLSLSSDIFEDTQVQANYCSFVFTNPVNGVLVTGYASNFNGKTFSFDSDIPEFTANLKTGNLIEKGTICKDFKYSSVKAAVLENSDKLILELQA